MVQFKISDDFLTRLASNSPNTNFLVTLRLTSGQYDLTRLDWVLNHTGGERLSEPDAFDSVRAKITPKFVPEIEKLGFLEAVIENQPISRIKPVTDRNDPIGRS